MPEEIDPSVLDSLYRCLANKRRRFILTHVCHRGDVSVSVDSLVETIVNYERHTTTPDEHQIALSLVHKHLPMLANSGLIEYDRDQGVVSATPRTDQLEPYLALIPSRDRSTELSD